MAKRLLCIGITIVFLCSSALADNVDKTGSGGAIPDNTGASLTSTITVLPADYTAGHLITNVNFDLTDFSHTWIGDLVVTVSHTFLGNNLGEATLFHRVGQNSDINGNPTGIGDSSNLNGTYFFEDGNASLWATAAADGAGDNDIGGGTFLASGELELVNSLNNIFGGQTPEGDWTFTISDLNTGTIGSLGGTSVHFVTTVPEPSTIAGLALAGMGGCIYLRRRRMKKKAAEATAA